MQHNSSVIEAALRGDAEYAHIYVGRVFTAPGGVFKFRQKYIITGVNRSTGTVTVRSHQKNDGEYHYQEVDKSVVPR